MDTKDVTRFDELEVKRIRIVDDDGQVRMAITSPPLPDGTFRGRVLKEQNRQDAGLIFYNDEGTECGGLTFSGKTGADGVTAGAGLLFDQYEQDQTIWLTYEQHGEKKYYGLGMMDRPSTSIADLAKDVERIEALDDSEQQAEMAKLTADHPQRVFLGREQNGAVALYLFDSKGRPRIRLTVDHEDIPRLQFLDENGGTTWEFPEAK